MKKNLKNEGSTTGVIYRNARAHKTNNPVRVLESGFIYTIEDKSVFVE